MRTLAAALGVALGVCILLLAPPPTDRAAALASYRIGDSVVLPSLESLDGAAVSLATPPFEGPSGTPREALVIEFWSSRCPVSRGYQAKVDALREAYAARAVEVIAITARPDESRTEIARRVAEGTAPPGLLIDRHGRLAAQFGVDTTPYFVVIDGDGALVYSGAFDSNLIDTGASLRTYLRNALDELLADRPVTVARTRAFGTPVPRATAGAPRS